MEQTLYLPAISNHVDTFGLGLAVVLGGFLQILLTSHALSVAVTSLRQRIGISPLAGNFEATQSQNLILLNTPTIEMAHTKLVNAQSKLCTISFLHFPESRWYRGVAVAHQLQTNGVHCFPQPPNTLPLIGTHTPAMTASQCIKKHGRGMVLFGRNAKVVCGLVKRSLLVALDPHSQMVVRRDRSGHRVSGVVGPGCLRSKSIT